MIVTIVPCKVIFVLTSNFMNINIFLPWIDPQVTSEQYPESSTNIQPMWLLQITKNN